jgi:hypothetical protein
MSINDGIFIDYNVGPVLLMNLTGIKIPIKEIKELEDIDKLRSHLSFYVFSKEISITSISNYLRPIILELKNNNIWFSSRPTAFTDSVGNYVAECYANNCRYNNYIYMTIQSRDYCLRTKELILYHNLDLCSKGITKQILDDKNVNYEWNLDNDNTIKIYL